MSRTQRVSTTSCFGHGAHTSRLRDHNISRQCMHNAFITQALSYTLMACTCPALRSFHGTFTSAMFYELDDGLVEDEDAVVPAPIGPRTLGPFRRCVCHPLLQTQHDVFLQKTRPTCSHLMLACSNVCVASPVYTIAMLGTSMMQRHSS